jgi:tetratricopeptide (TPR) repeat protein
MLTLLAYSNVSSCHFIILDDEVYVWHNAQVLVGWTGASLAWAWTTFHAGNWHPLTWMSLQLDAMLFGSGAAGFHLTNLLLHLANVLLLFWVLQRLTGAVWRSAVVAALFAVHPLHVESVAWVTERKDVLSTFFGLLALGAYGRYVERPGTGRYLLVSLFLALSLLAKPMLVTLPCVFLLLDYWPLRRWRPWPTTSGDEKEQSRPVPLSRLVWEKVPLFALCLASSVATYLAQSAGGAVSSLARLPLGLRLVNAVWAYGVYLLKTVWPRGLYPFYPLTIATTSQFVIAALVVGIVTALVMIGARRRPYLVVGWFWFVGTLVPVIGLVQAGAQALADRYTYFPHIGLFLSLVWGGYDLLDAWKRAVPIAASVVVILLLIGVWLTREQVNCWRDQTALCRHALAFDPHNYIARNLLGLALLQEGEPGQALDQFEETTRVQPGYAPALNNVGSALLALRKYPEAEEAFRRTLQIEPDNAETFENLGQAQFRQGKIAEALNNYREAVRLNPSTAAFRCNLALALFDQGEEHEARAQYREASRLDPAWAANADGIAWSLATSPRPSARDGALAVQLARQICQASDDPPPAYLDTLAAAYAEVERFDDAIAAAKRAVKSAAVVQPALVSELKQRLRLYEKHQPYREMKEEANRRE